MRWTLGQCESQAAGIDRLEAIKAVRPLSRAEKQTLAIAKAHFRAYGCRGTISRAGPSASTISQSSGVSLSSSNPMSLLDTLVGAAETVIGSGRASTTAPVAESSSPSLLSSVLRIGGTLLSSIVPGAAAAGTGLGTLAELPANASVGRATGDLNPDHFPLEAETGLTPAQTVAAYQGRRRMPSTGKVKRLVRCVGVVAASAMLGLTIPATALIATRPYRRRGISAASLRITRRTIRAVYSIQHSLSQIKPHRRR